MLKAIIIDVDKAAIRSLELILKEYCKQVTVFASTTSHAEGVLLIVKNKPDLIFLDIEMPEMNNLENLNNLPNYNANIVFTTTQNEYTVKAFNAGAIDYLLKPFDKFEVLQTINKIITKKYITNKLEKENLQNIIKNRNTSQTEKIYLTLSNKNILISIEDIIRLEADGSYTRIWLENGVSYLVAKNLKKFQEQLQHKNFFRAHKSHIINLSKVVSFILRTRKGIITMSDKSYVNIADTKKKEFLSIITNIGNI